ncbi:MAG: hypothetical protein AB7H80_12650 [Candidatus Kapaibacterium sp.]
MFKYHHHITCFLLFAIPSLRAMAQPGGEEQTLHVPPKLVVASQWSDEKPELYMYEYSYRRELPLLPMIFFDYPGDYTIPPRYQQFSGSYQARDYTDTNDVDSYVSYFGKYYELLNIIGYRMTKYPKTTIMLQGGYSHESGETEEIALTRAEVIREYLTNVWGIDTGRVAITPAYLASTAEDNILRQEEARRVMIHTGSWDLIGPVTYSVTSMETSPLHLRFMVEPNARPEDVEKLEFVMTCDDKVVGRTEVNGHPDSLHYQLEGYWWKGGADISPDRGAITVELLLHLRGGRYRRSNPFVIPVYLEGKEKNSNEELVEAVPELLLLPFYSFKDSTLSGYHRLLISDFLKKSRYPQQLALQLSGSSEMTEDPTVDDPTLITERQGYEGMNNNYFYYDPPEEGTLFIYTPREEEFDGDYDEAYYSEADIERMQAEELERSKKEEEKDENVGVYTIDSLAIARARGVATFLRDTLGISITNESEEFTKFSNNPNVASLNWMQRYIQADGYYPFIYRPEDRWYSRRVSMRVIPQYRVEGYRDWYRSRQEIDQMNEASEASDNAEEGIEDSSGESIEEEEESE